MNTFSQNIPDIINQAITQHSSKHFIVFGNHTITYGELKSKIGKYTSYFLNKGINKGDRVVFSSKDEKFTCYFYLSLIANGITAILIDSNGGTERSNAIINHCQPHSIFVDEELINKWNLTLTCSKNVIPIIQKNKNSILDKILRKNDQLPESFPTCTETLAETAIAEYIEPESDAYILYTSGTTSAPKGVRISYRLLLRG